MADLIKKIKIKKQDGTFTDYIPIGADAKNVTADDGESVEVKLNKTPYYYNTVADMQADEKLAAGDMAITLGYYEPQDGGAAKYRITTNIQIEYDNGLFIELDNGLTAELIVEESVNAKSIGCSTNVGFDNSVIINRFLKKYSETELFFPEGVYECNSSITSNKNIKFKMNNATLLLKSDNILDYFIAISPNPQSSTVINYNNGYINGVDSIIDANYKAKVILGTNLVRKFNIDITLKNSMEIGLYNRYTTIEDAVASGNIYTEKLLIWNDITAEKTIIPSETIGIYDNGHDNTIRATIQNFTTGAYVNSGNHYRIHHWLSKKYLFENSITFIVLNTPVFFDFSVCDTVRSFIKLDCDYAKVFLNQCYTLINTEIITKEDTQDYPITYFITNNKALPFYQLSNCFFGVGNIYGYMLDQELNYDRFQTNNTIVNLSGNEDFIKNFTENVFLKNSTIANYNDFYNFYNAASTVLTGASNFDEAINSHAYRVNTYNGTGGMNAIPNIAGIMSVFKSGNFITQFIIVSGNATIYTRFYSSEGGWNPWRKFTGSNVT